ncbi:ATP-dependent DNA helicase UvrD2 [Spiractinospora alimapuensis]|uniref:ATP-dependent DNA helicase UvrD2 n=1 Tax=Spiractinospora alimapuensis TaxID=2820884 RepID=UPI001F2810F5|nr:ATP-dependent DNA helicase UvrD2 [Spiractinospora alimapuensis]QVQ54018.1 ATP-dependent DNA helicase UvrD2 [Spiractinospora alimapuensis]
MHADRILEGLDPEQLEVARAVRGPVCVLAGAGTGKTRAITHRIAYAVASGVVNEQQILAVTFTTRAAGEMRGRLRQLGAPRVQARTFHSAALRQLSYFWPQVVGGPPPTLIESKLQAVAEVARGCGLTPGRGELRDLAGEIEWAKSTQTRPEDYEAAAAKAARETSNPPRDVARVYDAYEELRRERNLLDFESVLELTAAMLVDNRQVAERVRSQYRYFVVDEYQDVNPLQQLVLDAWLGDRDDVCVVGDPSQTIYSFTGATASYLTGFSAAFPHASVVRLVRDYRSTPQVVGLANAVLAQAKGDAARHRLELQAQRPTGPDPVFQEYDDEPAEAAGVARGIAALIASGTPAREIAVLYRVNAQSATYEQALADAEIPYVLRGAARFFERPEIRQAVHTLRGARLGATTDPLVTTVRHLLAPMGLSDTPPSGGQARERWESLAALAQLAEDMATARPDATMADFVQELEARVSTEHAPEFEGVTLASLHSAKGLEWDAVFLVGVVDGTLPIVHAKTPDQVEEERRLTYVGVTRAREYLSLSWALSRSPGGRRSRKPSPFLDGARPNTAKKTPERRGGARQVDCRVCGARLIAAAERKLGRCTDCPSSYDEALLERLKAWRRDVAEEQKVPAYVVFTDATLQAVAEQVPTDARGLARISGVGSVKLERYGEAVLALCAGESP